MIAVITTFCNMLSSIELDVLKEHTAVNYMVLAAAPQPLVGSEQIQG